MTGSEIQSESPVSNAEHLLNNVPKQTKFVRKIRAKTVII